MERIRIKQQIEACIVRLRRGELTEQDLRQVIAAIVGSKEDVATGILRVIDERLISAGYNLPAAANRRSSS